MHEHLNGLRTRIGNTYQKNRKLLSRTEQWSTSHFDKWMLCNSPFTITCWSKSEMLLFTMPVAKLSFYSYAKLLNEDVDTSESPRASLRDTFCRLQIFCRWYEVLSLPSQLKRGRNHSLPGKLSNKYQIGWMTCEKTRSALNSTNGYPISPVCKKLFFLTECINHLFKNVRHRIGSGK